MIYKYFKKLVVSIFTLCTLSASSQQDSINCFIEVQDIWDLNQNNSTVKADFYLTFDYENELNKYFNLLNGSIISIDTIIDNKASNYLTLRILAELRTNFDFSHHPLDKQTIQIKIEPFQYYENLIYYSYPDQNIFVDTINLMGWQANKIFFKSKLSKYLIHEKNGDTTYNYSTATWDIPIVRENYFFYFLKSYLPSLISILIIYIGFLLPPNQIEPRLNLSVGSLFVMISNFIVAQQILPEVSTITLIEKINIISLVIIFLTILYFSLSFKLREHYSNNVWYKLNSIYVIATLVTYLSFLIVFI
jgi:hypothetical protein